jgi:hypothetical protein
MVGETCIPKNMVCPLTKAVMEDPVSTIHGETFSRRAIRHWLDTGNDTSPVTGEKLLREGKIDTSLAPNYDLRKGILEWRASQKGFDSGISLHELRIDMEEVDNVTDAQQQKLCPLYVSAPERLKIKACMDKDRQKSVYRGVWGMHGIRILHMHKERCETEVTVFQSLNQHANIATVIGMAVDGKDGSQHFITELPPLGSMDKFLEGSKRSLVSKGEVHVRYVMLQVVSQVRIPF